MFKADLKLKEVFKSNSLELMRVPGVTRDGDLTWTKDNRCYIWELEASEVLKKKLTKGEKRVYGKGGYSMLNYIQLTDEAFELCLGNCFTLGPNSNTPRQTLYFRSSEDETTIIFQGWGNSSVRLWKGRTCDLLRYLKDLQGA